ncbi:50S ribosomal protein L4 [candidate division WOR-3 bacterium]|nr:50S ribosomal protein L4 [candidate division WOR-3 bacterium]
MIQLTVFNEKGEDTGKKVDLPDDVFSVEPNKSVIHQAVVTYLANRRQGNASVKTRAEVSGGGKKPWRQKGTGRARQGSIRAVQWRGGGVAHGPKVRKYTKKINKKMKNLAIKSVLSLKAEEGSIKCVEKALYEKPRTARVKSMLASLQLENKKILFVNDEYSKEFLLSAQNIPEVKTALAASVNTYDIINAQNLVLTPESIAIFKEVFSS